MALCVMLCFVNTAAPLGFQRGQLFLALGPFKCYVTQMGWGGGVRFSGKKRYEGVMFNAINVTRGWVGVQFAEK